MEFCYFDGTVADDLLHSHNDVKKKIQFFLMRLCLRYVSVMSLCCAVLLTLADIKHRYNIWFSSTTLANTLGGTLRK